jgi:hypothetical protein
MSLAIVQKDDFLNQLVELDRIHDTCKKLLATKHYMKLGEEGIYAVVARARSLGIHPLEALNGGFHVVNGKVGMSTEMMAALVRQRGHSITKDSKSNGECVILHGKRADNGDTWTCTFTRSDAEMAGLWNGPTWKKYPQVMLYNRCMSMLFRQLFPDLSLGAGYVEDELKEITKTGDYQNVLPMAEYEIKNEEKQKVEPKAIVRISNEQAVNISNILDECPIDIVASTMDFLKKNKITDLSQLTPEIYEKLLPRLMAKREENIALQQQEFSVQEGVI